MHNTNKLSLLVMAAGMGSRYGGLKQIDGFGPSGECILEYSIYDAVRAGFDEVILVIRKDIEDDFRENVGQRLEGHIDVKYVYQELDALPGERVCPDTRKKPWGTGHAALMAMDLIENNFACINADDFYGPDAYVQMASFLRSVDPASHEYSLTTYDLGKTVSDHGHVSRGICTVDGSGYLEKILEHTNITKTDNGPIHTRLDGGIVQLTDETPASMSFFGFTPAFFDVLSREFETFLDTNIMEEKYEFYLPFAIDQAVKKDGATVKVIHSHDDWYGVTNIHDKPICQEAICGKVEQGVYPDPLWKD